MTLPMSCEQAIALLERAGINLEERLPWGMSTSRQIMELFTEAARGVFVPNQFTTDTAWARYHFQDVENMTDVQLWRDVERAKFLLVWHEDPGEWIADRMRACQAEMTKRQKKATAK